MAIVYKITNKVNNKFYIGSTCNPKLRFSEHVNDLRKQQHHNIVLQRAWNKHKESNFVFSVLLYCETEYQIEHEQWFLDNWKPHYNIAKFADAPNRGRKFPDRVGKPLSNHHKQQISKGLKESHARSPRSAETRQKLRLAMRARCINVKGEKNGRSILTSSKVAEIRESSLSRKDLSQKYKVSIGAIFDILNYRTWKHI